MSGSASPCGGRTHAELADLVRELLLAGHLIDRAGMPHLISRLGREGMGEVAIGEWMAASPLYARRMQRLLDFEGDSVATIFKGMQLDIGAPPEFMDFRYTVTDQHHGAFQLAHCGALMDVEPMGDEFVTTMCHDIEDPTFDATAAATNSRAQVRPLHRPPRSTAERTPHCAWTVTIDPDAEPLPFPAQATRLSESTAAHLPLPQAPASLTADDGWNDYRAPLRPELVMEDFSSATLARIADEVALQGHLLSRAFLLEVLERTSAPAALDLGARQLTGISGVVAKRLASLLGVAPDLDGIAEVLRVHPLLLPRAYVDVDLSHTDDHLTVSIAPCPALAERDGLTWPAILVEADDRGLAAAVQCVAPHAQVVRVDPCGTAVATWLVTIDPEAAPAPDPADVVLTEFSTGADFQFSRRGRTRTERTSPVELRR